MSLWRATLLVLSSMVAYVDVAAFIFLTARNISAAASVTASPTNRAACTGTRFGKPMESTESISCGSREISGRLAVERQMRGNFVDLSLPTAGCITGWLAYALGLSVR